MSYKKFNEVEEFLKNEMLQLKLMSFTIKKASKKFNIPQNEIRNTYSAVRSKIRKESVNRGLVYMLLSSIFLLVGIKSTYVSSVNIYLGALLLFGGAGILTSFGYFIMAIKGKSS